MAIEEVIQLILQKCPQKTREELLERLHNEETKTGNLIAETTLLRMIAADWGVEIPQNQIYEQKFSINHLFAGLNNVTIIGRVIAVYPAKTFEGKTPGKYASAIISDKDTIIRVMLWNENADPVEEGRLKPGKIVRLAHGYTKEGRDGKVELHMSEKSQIEIDPQDIKPEDLPVIGKFGTKINQLNSIQQKTVHLTGTVKKTYPSSNFLKTDQTDGAVKRILIEDDTGTATVVVWNEKATEAEQTLSEKDKIELVNARIKITDSGETEIHVDSATFMNISKAEEQTSHIAELKSGFTNVNVKCEVITEPAIKEVKIFTGETVKLASFEIKDETGSIRVVAWREQANAAITLKKGIQVLLKNISVKQGRDQKLELSTIANSSITMLQQAKPTGQEQPEIRK
jgi:ssDNA-binding replication factor A large subunit